MAAHLTLVTSAPPFLITLAVNACLRKCKDAGFDTRIGISLARLIKTSRRGVEILEIQWVWR
jgi:hypothetical protein